MKKVQIVQTKIKPCSEGQKYLVFCDLIKKGNAYPSQQSLIIKLDDKYYTNPEKYIIEKDDISIYDRFACIVKNNNAISVINSYIPKNLVEESPSINYRIEEITDSSVQLYINSTINAYVWCNAYEIDQDSPSVKEMKRKKPMYITKEEKYEISGLVPNTKYYLYCYGESPLGSPMNTEIQSLKQYFSTKERNTIIIEN